MKTKLYLIICLLLVLAGCSDKTIHTDTWYCFHHEKNGEYYKFPWLYFNSETGLFKFIYDQENWKSDREGYYEIKGNKLTLTNRLDKSEKYVFRIIDENTLQFIAGESHEVRDAKGIFYPLENGDKLYDFRYKPYDLSEFDVDKCLYTSFTAGNDDYLETGFEYAKFDYYIWAEWENGKIAIKEVRNNTCYLTFIDESVKRYYIYVFDGLYPPKFANQKVRFDSEDFYTHIKERGKSVIVYLKLEGMASALFVLDERGNIHMLKRSAYGEGPVDAQKLSYEQMSEVIPYMMMPEIFEWDGQLR